MATGRTVRQVKHGERLRRSQTSLNPVSAPDIEIKAGDVARVVKTKKLAEVDGYGPYKPVPPPKPLPQQPGVVQEQQSSSSTPPPYRMPPYPLYNEPSIPGATVLDPPIATSSPAPQGLHTHSSKFPIEREVILSSTDKNSKIPILHDYKKRSKTAVAPDVPPKQMAAWTQNQVQNHQILPDQTHSGLIQTIQQTADTNGSPYRSNYHQIQDYYNGQNINPTGAVPRTAWHAPADNNKPLPRSLPTNEDFSVITHNPHSQSVAVQIENKDVVQKDQKNKTMAKTYNTIKDMLSSRFKSNKDSDDRMEESGLNNVAEELRKSQGNVADEGSGKKQSQEQGYSKPPVLPPQYSQNYMQQQMLAQHAQQQYQQQLKNQQYSQHIAQARSQEMLNQQQAEEQLYYQSNYVATPQRRQVPVPGREGNYVPMQSHVQTSPEKRSAQQLERDNLRQRSFETRRAASQPQLAYDDEVQEELPNRKPQPQIPTPMRRGSYGNIVEAQTKHEEKDSDDGGFLKRKGSQERRLDPPGSDKNARSEAVNEHKKDEDHKINDGLQGSPRKRLEGEIGKIEGVYNIGQRSAKTEEENKIGKKNNPSSATSSDYDKTGGQSSSNIDSGRGSAAYSSGRRPGPLDSNSDHFDSVPISSRAKYRESHDTGHDSEWVDIVENELRHILEPKLHELSIQNNPGKPHSMLSESVSSMTPPLPPLSPGDQSSPNTTPRNSARYKHSSLPCGSRPEYESYKGKSHLRNIPSDSRWNNSSPQKHRSQKKLDHNAILRGKQIFGLDNTDMTSTTTRSMDLESILDGQSDSDEDLSTTDARAIRKQLEGLETMYSEVLKLLGVKKHPAKYQPNDPRFTKRRYGSMSSLPSSSVSSRPIRDKRRANEDRKKVRDIRGINKRFQRLESHVVTLARSVAHLSSEMRTQHLMIQEMESIRSEIAALRTQTNMLNVRAQNAARAVSSKDLPVLANPARVKKLTKFFGDEPPLLRLFLKKLGYEKYATIFETERIGMVELPYLSEERLQKMGLPLGPRLRIMQEAQISVCKDNTLCIV
ncbi:uncharacterized protein LOC114349276 isoform X2 [Diabrotica virgifera virgifera]|uniref:Uncharacterized protein LOC114349276 isoform X2 n=1 Tax=Diabrotica virgifera virgifera TaxID=50390 RepID=A0A6P7HCT8_DIAVI|nr:uncharacterized protein LOC114349276 isoform X2 [Diabrotica virgifera virgifera]